MAFTLIWCFQCVPMTFSGTLRCFMHINQRGVNVTPKQWLCWLTISMTQTTENISRRIIAFEFFTVCTKLAEMAILYSNDLTAKKVTSSGTRPDATNYYWFRSPVPNQMS